MTESFISDTKGSLFKPFRNARGNLTDCNIADDNINSVPYQNDLQQFFLQTLLRFRSHQKHKADQTCLRADKNEGLKPFADYTCRYGN